MRNRQSFRVPYERKRRVGRNSCVHDADNIRISDYERLPKGGSFPPAGLLGVGRSRCWSEAAASGWRLGEALGWGCESCQSSEVLNGRGEEELIAGTGWTSETKPIKSEMAFEMCKEHLDLLAPSA